MKAKELLTKLEACEESIEWAGEKTIEEAWETCERGDWMLWFYKKMYPDNLSELTIAKGHCANTVRHLMKDQRSIDAVDAAISFGEGKIKKEELKKHAAYADAAYADAAYADAAYADAAYAASAAYAAYAAAYAASAYAAYAAADYAAYAAYAAAYAADYAAYAYAAYAAKKQNQQQTADICRKYLTIDFKKE